MRESTRRPAAAGDAEGPQSADADADASGADAQTAARQQRAHERRASANDAEADEFNQRHASKVAEFNQRTHDACVGEDGKLYAAAVKQWQREHGVAPDGKVGPKTVAAAAGKSSDAKGDAQLKPAADGGNGRPKAKGPIDEIVSWLDVEMIHRVLAELESVARPPKESAPRGGSPEVGKSAMTGLASDVSIDRFVAAVKQIEGQSEWKKLTGEQRAGHMVRAANEQLAAAGVRRVHQRFSDELSATNPGRFVHEEWTMELNKRLFAAKTLKPGQGAAIAEAVYHESRHAEQNYRIVQLLAGQKKSVEEIKKLTNIDSKTIALAYQQPIADGAAGAGQAQALFDDKYGAGKEHHHQAEVDARVKLAAFARVKARVENDSATAEEKEAAHKELEAMKPDAIAAWNTYSTLATEADAFAVEARVTAKMK